MCREKKFVIYEIIIKNRIPFKPFSPIEYDRLETREKILPYPIIENMIAK